MIYIETPRLRLRDWEEADFPLFADMNADKRVMEFFLKPLSRGESRGFFLRIIDEIRQYGFGLFANDTREDNRFIGFTGLHNITFDVDFAPGVEIGWRLLPQAWGKGYATEAALACLEYARSIAGLDRVYSFTSLPNKRSERVMQKIGMTKIREFGHPSVDPGHPLYMHSLYETEL